MASPKPRPAALKLIEGRGPGRDSGGRAVKPPPGFTRLPPEPPSHLGEHAREEWERVVPELQRLELLKPIDRAALTAYCEMWETFVRATEDVHHRGLVVENHSVRKDGSESTWYTANPAVGVQKSAQAALRAWCAEFGLSPSAEANVAGRDGAGGDEANPFASTGT